MQQLMSICLTLRPAKTNRIPMWLGQATHSFYLSSLQAIHPDLSEVLHDRTTGVQPFTASNLMGAIVKNGMMEIRPAQACTLRYTTLHPQVTMLTLNGMIPMWAQTDIELHDQFFAIEDMNIDAADYAWAGISNYDDLLSDASSNKTITIQFNSPTAFKSKGKFITLPEPRLVFGSLFRRWNAYSPALMPDEVHDSIEEIVTVTKHDIHTASARTKKRRSQKGFVGTVTFQINSDNALLRQYLNALAGFAKYSGIGIRTGVGLGQAKVV